MARQHRRLTMVALSLLTLLAFVGAQSSGIPGTAGASTSAAPSAHVHSADHHGTPTENPAKGMVWKGIEDGDAGPCPGSYEAKNRHDVVVACTHGPDPAPAGTDVRTDGSTAELVADSAAAGGSTAVPCIGDGTSGYRVEAIYAVPSDRTDRFSTIEPLITSSYAPRVEDQFARSAAETGGEAHVQWVTTPDGVGGCTLVVHHEVLSVTGDDTFGDTITELKARGYTRADRKYLVWMDSNVYCGIGQVYGDTRPDQANANNGAYSMFARADSGCWAYAEGHELMHNLGGVQPSAPNGTPNYHCSDEPDEMCYDDDGSGPVVMRSVCTGRDGTLFDCNHDDYFYAGTAPSGSWLSTHWNTWSSRFLIRTALPTGATNAPPTVSAGPDRTGTRGQPIALDGTVTDDGLPAGSSVTTTWTVTSGPGTVTFGNAAAVDTSATFSAAGTYVLQLTASDGSLGANDTMTTTVSEPVGPVTEQFAGTLGSGTTSITHAFASGKGTISVTFTSPSGKRAVRVTATLYSPTGAKLRSSSATGTRTFSVTGTVAGTYRLVVTGTTGSYTASVTHPG
jgi:hypothetical protein